MLTVHLFTYCRYLLARARHDERGQASAEYALVLLGAAAVALLITAWATNTDLVGQLLDTVLKHITGQAK
jgi:Flp pilus assembly pilin Flp